MKKLFLLFCLVFGLALAAGSATATSNHIRTYIDNCGHHVRHPAKLTLACADGNYYLASLKWHHWGRTKARATGLAWVNDCKPTCAGGKFKSYPITAKASMRKACKSHRVYRRLSVTYTRSQPRGIPNPDVVRLGCV